MTETTEALLRNNAAILRSLPVSDMSPDAKEGERVLSVTVSSSSVNTYFFLHRCAGYGLAGEQEDLTAQVGNAERERLFTYTIHEANPQEKILFNKLQPLVAQRLENMRAEVMDMPWVEQDPDHLRITKPRTVLRETLKALSDRGEIRFESDSFILEKGTALFDSVQEVRQDRRDALAEVLPELFNWTQSGNPHGGKVKYTAAPLDVNDKPLLAEAQALGMLSIKGPVVRVLDARLQAGIDAQQTRGR